MGEAINHWDIYAVTVSYSTLSAYEQPEYYTIQFLLGVQGSD
jgi:hypothetical protein